MSIPVPLTELGAALTAYPWGYLVTVGDDMRAHALAMPTNYDGSSLRVAGGRTARRNIVPRPEVTMVFPHPSAGEYSLIVDGTATAADDDVVVTPSHAVLHRPAITTG
ncbi:MAG: hypothetical protein LH616_12040 [Ilumatobacteraceae bacterium]|nr:hypothetical protein [Ilumatobacteraceae bacterium]